MKNRILISILSILIMLSWSSQGSSLVVETHQAINEYIAKNAINGFSLNDYLINNLGLGKGVYEIIRGEDADGVNVSHEVFWWLGYGGIQEDRPGSDIDYLPFVGQPTRSVNHFHNPLVEPWEYSGLDDSICIIRIPFTQFCIGSLHYTGQSSIIWAQNPNQDPGRKWSWYQAREYYYIGLTGRDIAGNVVAPTKAARDASFANTFRALGQLMHLVHDASVPAHSRNQIHIRFNYEDWVEKIRTGDPSERVLFGQFIANPKSFDPSILNKVISDPSIVVLDPSPPIPIANIIDTNTYSGSNPDPGVTAGTTIGIAEYTNANFFSEHTIFENFPYPNKNTSVDVEDRQIPDPRGVRPSVKRPYYIKKRDGESSPSSESLAEGKEGYRLATVGYLYRYITAYFPAYRYMDKPALDGGVYNDYAEKLLPRAVGYSAGLLNYFFRGKIEITEPIIDQGNTRVTLKAKNTTPNNEKMTGGDNASIMLVVKYKVPSGQDYLYIVTPEKNDIKSIPRGDPIQLTFDLSLSPLPIDATDISFQLVYKGKLGKGEGINWVGEEDGVGVGLKMNESPYLIAWYRNNEGAGNVVKNYATDGSLGGRLLPDLDVFSPDDFYIEDVYNPGSYILVSGYWSAEGFGHSELQPGISIDEIPRAEKVFSTRTLSSQCGLGGFYRRSHVPDFSWYSMATVYIMDIAWTRWMTLGLRSEDGLVIRNWADNYINEFAIEEIENDIDEWYFQFLDSNGFLNVVFPDGTKQISEAQQTIGPVSMEKITLGGSQFSGSIGCYIDLGDVIIYNNYIVPLSEWAAWYDALRERYGMAPRSGW